MENTGKCHFRKNKIKISQSSVGIIVISLVAGIFNGLIGAGGGLILSFGLSALVSGQMKEKKDVYFNSQAAMIPVSIVSYFLYARSGSATEIPFHYMLFPALAGGIAGGVASSYIDSKYIRLIFAVIVMFSGARMVFSALG